MNRTIIVANHHFVVTTKEWAFEEDESYCIDLVEAGMLAEAESDAPAFEVIWESIYLGETNSELDFIVREARKQATGGFAAPESSIVSVYSTLRRDTRERHGVR